MDEKDFVYTQKLIKWIAENASYGDITELCKELNVPEEWFELFYEWEE